MIKSSNKFLFLLLALSLASMSAHGYIEHETEACKVCLFKVNERNDVDLDSCDDGALHKKLLAKIIRVQTPLNSIAFTLSFLNLTGSKSIRGPPFIS